MTLTTLLPPLFLLAALIGWTISLIATIKSHLHILQLEDYESARMLKIQLRNLSRWNLAGWDLAAAPFLIGASFLFQPYSPSRTASTLFLAGCLIWGAMMLRSSARKNQRLKLAKKALILTARAKRILWVTLLASALIWLWGSYRLFILCSSSSISFAKSIPIGSGLTLEWNYPIVFGWLLFLTAYMIERGSPFFLTIASAILRPVETTIQRRYLRDARRIIAELHPIVIGITGSYGKTGTKALLTAMLARKSNVYCPPGSYNTLMGITRVIRDGLRPYHDLFVVEMGAYRVGSIARLCDLVHPTHGIITTIGVQHLERFKNQDAIRQAKSELIKALPLNGISVLNGDDDACRTIANDSKGEVVFFSLAKPDPNVPTVVADQIQVGLNGTDFRIRYADSEYQNIHLSLLGRSAVSNAVAAAAMADRLGVPRKAISEALASMPHVRHRLEPISRAGGITVIDDAYNSNPVGARNALELLAQAKTGRRILLTPGMIELGEMEVEANRQFGRDAAAACDLVVLVGLKRSKPIAEGLLELGFSPDAIWTVGSLNTGLERLTGFLKAGDTILLENDLPDQYSE